ncbi:MAG: rRNA maturation RNase YbeY [Gammaproteobacteria bacterium]|nr:MAG: rRNA maturation RNase YbeY [Gammaproteobacteria bacterium]
MLALDLQLAIEADNLPSQADFERWVSTALTALSQPDKAELTIRITSNDEVQQLNRDYRGKDKPTNVLSFPFEPYEALMAYAGDAAELNLLGDIIIAHDVIVSEAQAQNKPVINHYAHMTLHGVLHLLGYDHIEDDEAQAMEALETQMLAGLGIADPYRVV